MTNAREIIAYTIPGTSAELCFGLADAIIERLGAAGYRILGPDEVDQVTVEKCAQIAEGHAAAASEMAEAAYFSSASSAVLNCGRGIAHAIRTLGRKA